MKMKVTLDANEVHQIVKDYLFKKFPKKTVDMTLLPTGGAEATLEDAKEWHTTD